ncbi:MAG: hypothetical protein V4540_14270 [Pseudomonadota bacterium]
MFKRRSRDTDVQTPLTRHGCSNAAHAALSHIAVSNALLIIGMFMPKLAFAALFAAGLTGLSATLGATSVARSHDPNSWERATEKNRST